MSLHKMMMITAISFLAEVYDLQVCVYYITKFYYQLY